jgi:methyl-accepting chemotaxis protein
MQNRRLTLHENLESGPQIRIGALVYLILSLLTASAFCWAWFNADHTSKMNSPTMTHFLVAVLPFVLAALNLLGAGLLVLLLRKCRCCRSGPGRRISAAVEKMSKGDLGWKITLRKGDDLAPIAESVTNASRTLADRIGKLQCNTRELTALEEYLQDSIESDRTFNPHTLKALRKLKICTTRLKTEVEDFQVSMVFPKEHEKTVINV